MVLLVLLWFVISGRRAARQAAADTAAQLAEQHRAMLGDVHGALQQQGDRVISQGGQAAERLRQPVGGELGGHARGHASTASGHAGGDDEDAGGAGAGRPRAAAIGHGARRRFSLPAASSR
ncbi:MAG: hypothetical protein MZW92_49830 [Comamonadaceae bacterium]|nr:hypothetical protein [Comamonadaceae bacterium]